MGALEDNPAIIVTGIIGVIVALVYFMVDSTLGNVFSGLFDTLATQADSYGSGPVGSIIRVFPSILFIGVPTGVIVASLKLFRGNRGSICPAGLRTLMSPSNASSAFPA